MEKIKQGHEGYFRQGSHAVSLKRSHEAKPPVTTWRKNIPGGGGSRCRGPVAEASTLHWRNRKKAVGSQGGDKGEDGQDGSGPMDPGE